MEKGNKIFIPEINLITVVQAIVDSIRDDLRDGNEKESFLYQILQDYTVSNYQFYKQAKELFLRKNNDKRMLEVRLFFDAHRAELPTIHINLPMESTTENGLGSDEGFAPPLFDDTSLEFIRRYNRRFSSNYQILFSSNNSLEVITMYHVVRAAIIANLGVLELYGFTNLSMSGGDLQLHPDIVPQGVFVRGLNLNFGYEVTAPAIKREKFYTNFILKIKTIIK